MPCACRRGGCQSAGQLLAVNHVKIDDSCKLWLQLDDAKGTVKILYHSQKEYEHITGRLLMLREWRVSAFLLLLPAEQVMLHVAVRLIGVGTVPILLLCHYQHIPPAAMLPHYSSGKHLANTVPVPLTGWRAAGRIPPHGAGLAAQGRGAAVHCARARLQVGQARGAGRGRPHGGHQKGAPAHAQAPCKRAASTLRPEAQAVLLCDPLLLTASGPCFAHLNDCFA
jgi:hypothetical protein